MALSKLIFLMQLLGSVLSQEISGFFKQSNLNFCLDASKYPAARESSKLACGQKCLSKASCCGFHFSEGSLCTLLDNLPPNRLSGHTIDDMECSFYIRQGCTACPHQYNITFPSSQGRLFYKTQVEQSFSEPADCPMHGYLFQPYPAQLFKDVGNYLKDRFNSNNWTGPGCVMEQPCRIFIGGHVEGTAELTNIILPKLQKQTNKNYYTDNDISIDLDNNDNKIFMQISASSTIFKGATIDEVTVFKKINFCECRFLNVPV